MRRLFLQACALASVLAMAACAQAPAATGTAEDEAAIRANGGKFAEAWTKGDVAAISAMMADNYQGVAEYHPPPAPPAAPAPDPKSKGSN